MRSLILAVVLLAPLSAVAAQASWTGNVEAVQTLTGKRGVRCEYSYRGETFWQTFDAFSCPVRINVE